MRPGLNFHIWRLGRPGRYRYVCPNGHWIDDSQRGEWIADDPTARDTSVHFHQMLSPDISPGEIMQKYVTSTDKTNFFNRVLGSSPVQEGGWLEAASFRHAVGDRPNASANQRLNELWRPYPIKPAT